MKNLIVPMGLALAQLLAVSAFAQTKGEVDPAQSKAVPAPKVTAEEKAAAKKARRATGASVAKSTRTEADASPESAGVAKAATKEQRVAAAAKRKQAAADAVKKGQISSGEK